MKSQMGHAHTHTPHGGNSQDSRGPQRVRRRGPLMLCTFTLRAASQGHGRLLVLLSSGPSARRAPGQDGWGLPPDAGPGPLSPLEGPRGKTGQVCCGGPERRPGGA